MASVPRPDDRFMNTHSARVPSDSPSRWLRL
jgi:hypothetical protein